MGQRYGAQLGGLDAVMRTRGRFLISTAYVDEALSVASQIARNLFQYFAADSEIVPLGAAQDVHPGNVISIALGPNISASLPEIHPIAFNNDSGLSVRNALGVNRTYAYEEGLGAIYLKALPNERLELIVWGYDSDGLRHAARLVPMLTGVGQPDFIVVSKKCAWKGAAGVSAMGFFDNSWQVSGSSFFI